MIKFTISFLVTITLIVLAVASVSWVSSWLVLAIIIAFIAGIMFSRRRRH